jgi:putative ABC transport system permease protein
VVGFSQGEVAGVLLGELSLLVACALPVGLLFGKGLTVFIITTLSTETVRMPLVVSAFTYSTAIIVVSIAACSSFIVVARMLKKLDLVGVLKARE